jgi:hypothetical protein
VGCNLGEDAFLMEEETESKADVLSHHNNAFGLEGVQWEMDDLVDDLNKAWTNSNDNKH